MMSCKEASRLLSQGQDRDLSRRQRWGLRLHLMLCNACRQFSVQLSFLRQAMRTLGHRLENNTEIVLTNDARERINATVRQRAVSTTVARQDPE